MALPIDPELYEPEIPRPRPGPGGSYPIPEGLFEPGMDPIPGLGVPGVGRYEYEPPRYLPPEQPGRLARLLSPFAEGINLPSNAPPLAQLFTGLLQGVGRQRVLEYQRKQAERQEQNRRFESAAAYRNRQNVALSGAERSARGAALREVREQIRKDKEREQNTILVPGTRERIERSSALGQWILSGKTPQSFRETASLETIESGAAARARGAASARPARPATVKFGPLIPSLTSLSRDLTTRSATARASYRNVVADSLGGLASEVDRIHSQLRETQTAQEVDSINVPDNLPAEVVKALASAARLRKAQLGNSRPTPVR